MAESPIIESIKSKISQLIARNRQQAEEYRKLSAERDKLRLENRRLTEKIAEQEKRISVLELKSGFSGNSDNSKLARARVNRLMREIDKCIALMNR